MLNNFIHQGNIKPMRHFTQNKIELKLKLPESSKCSVECRLLEFSYIEG